jgi:hypothetical protein
MSEQQNRFVTRPLTLREMVWLYKASKGDMEAMGFLLEARRVDPAFDVYALEGEEVAEAINEMNEACQEGQSVDMLLRSVKIQ